MGIKKDWTGNTNSVFKTLSATSHTTEERETNDFYATEPLAISLLLEMEKFNHNIWEPAAGDGSLSKVLEQNGYIVKSTDLIDRGYCISGVDFLQQTEKFDGDIITNPPYSLAKEFVEHALNIISDGNKVAMFLKMQFMETKGRKDLFLNNPPKVVYVSSSRLICAKNGDFEAARKVGSAVAYCWFVWEKGFYGDTIIKWFN